MYLLMKQFGADPAWALWSSAIVITSLRLLTWKFNMRIGR
jgi:hypothetical protein